jgi:NAD(P)H-hydrate epimerase
MPTLVLMENAGRGAAELLRNRLSPDSRVLILCGPGNNGGDGGVVARHLDVWGVSIEVVWFTDPAKLRGDAAVQFQILARAGINQSVWPADRDLNGLDALMAQADWVVDALLGTGLTRPVKGTLHAVIEAINRSGKPVLALDLPSGLDTDRGTPLGAAVRATLTATFVAPKLGFSAPGASEYLGAISVVEIGVPRRLLDAFAAPAPPIP